MIINCEVCSHNLQGPIIDLGKHPLNDDMQKVGVISEPKKYPQVIQMCSVCFTAHQLYPVNKETLFFPEYRYRGSVTKDVTMGMRDLVENALLFYGKASPKFVLDIGANDGSLLGIIKEKTNCQTIGVDPTHAVYDNSGRIDHVYCEFFSEETARKIIENHGKPDIITFTNVFAHIEDLPKLIQAVSHLLSDNNLLVIENHYIGSVLEKNQFDTFYAEHIRTYSAKSFEYIARDLNVEIKSVQFPRRYGGNIRVYMSRNKSLAREVESANEKNFVNDFGGIQNTYDGWRLASLDKIENILREGPMIGKSCPARSVMLFSSLEMDSKKMGRVFEHPDSPKIGHYVPGTEIPIVSDNYLQTDKSRNLILWSWHIAYELVPYLKDVGFRGNVWTPLPQFKLLEVI